MLNPPRRNWPSLSCLRQIGSRPLADSPPGVSSTTKGETRCGSGSEKPRRPTVRREFSSTSIHSISKWRGKAVGPGDPAGVEHRCLTPAVATIPTIRVSRGPGPGYLRRAAEANADSPTRSEPDPGRFRCQATLAPRSATAEIVRWNPFARLFWRFRRFAQGIE
jgi:hypothetical protein